MSYVAGSGPVLLIKRYCYIRHMCCQWRKTEGDTRSTVLPVAQQYRYKTDCLVHGASLTVLGQDYFVSRARPAIQIQKLSAVHGARQALLIERRPTILIQTLCAVHSARLALLTETRPKILIQKLCAVHGARLALVTEIRQDSQDQQHRHKTVVLSFVQVHSYMNGRKMIVSIVQD